MKSTKKCILFVPVGSRKVYQSTAGWNQFECIEELSIAYDNIIYASSLESRASSKVTIPINMKNNIVVTGYSFTLVVPEGIDPSSITLKKSTVRKEDGVAFSKAVQADGTIKVVCYTTDGLPFAGNDGEIATLTFTVPADMEEGNYSIIIKETEISENGKAYRVEEEIPTLLRVEKYLLGDANNDQVVSVSDLSTIVNYLLGYDVPDSFNVKAADANEDGSVSVSDLSSIVTYLLFGTMGGSRNARNREEEGSVFTLSSQPISIAPGETKAISLQLDNSIEVSAFQLDAHLLDGMNCIEAIPAGRIGEEQNFNFAQMEQNTTRILSYSPSNEAIDGEEGTIVVLTIKAEECLTPGLYTLTLENVELVSRGIGYTLDPISLSIEVTGSSSIETLSEESATTLRYDFMGRPVNESRSGIFFELGNKKLLK